MFRLAAERVFIHGLLFLRDFPQKAESYCAPAPSAGKGGAIVGLQMNNSETGMVLEGRVVNAFVRKIPQKMRSG
jgi:hypothetical protein